MPNHIGETIKSDDAARKRTDMFWEVNEGLCILITSQKRFSVLLKDNSKLLK